MRLAYWQIAGGLVAAAAAATMLEQRILWGYWVSRPSLAEVIKDADRVVAVSAVNFPWVRSDKIRPVDRQSWLRRALSCDRWRDNCLSQELGEVLSERKAFDLAVSEMSERDFDTVWSTIMGNRDWRPPAAPERAGWPTAGIIIRYDRQGEELLFAQYSTSQLSDDHYALVEATIDPASRMILKQMLSYFDQAGMEGLTWPVLWVANLILLIAVGIPFSVMLRHKKRGSGQGSLA